MHRWEYMVMPGPKLTQQELNQLGEQGWELAGVAAQVYSPESAQGPYDRRPATTTVITFYFKRPKS